MSLDKAIKYGKEKRKTDQFKRTGRGNHIEKQKQ